MRTTKTIILLAALLPVISAWAGDLSTDNLTVTKDAAIYGKMDVCFVAETNSAGTNTGALATGGTVTTNDGYIIHVFTNVSTTNFVVSSGSLTCDVLVVAGGGGGGSFGGGGGAGGLIYVASTNISGSSSITIGGGGYGSPGPTDGGVSGGTGTNSVFGSLTAYGGGGGGSRAASGTVAMPGLNGGAGGGGSGCDSGTKASGGLASPSGQGYNGGSNAVYGHGCGGGGGAGAVGANTDGNGANGGNGGVGLEYSQFACVGGSPAGWFAGGGGGAAYSGTAGTGGSGGGGDGTDQSPVAAGHAGVVNTGGGGGGSTHGQHGGNNGGSGIVIVRYQTTTSSNSYVSTLTFSSNGISQTSTSAANVFMGKVGIGTNNPAEQLHVAGNARVDGTNIVSAITLGGETRTTWPTGNLSASNNLADITDQAVARTNLGLGSAATNDAGAFLAPNGDGSQITGITAAQVGALSTNAGALIAANNLSDVADIATARDNLGALSTTGGVVSGNLDVQGSMDIQYIPPKGDLGMGSYTNQ